MVLVNYIGVLSLGVSEIISYKYSGATRGGGRGDPSFAPSPNHILPPPPHSPHLTPGWSWLWTIFNQISQLRKR